MYFLGASGRIVGGESNPHTPSASPLPRLPFTFLSRYGLSLSLSSSSVLFVLTFFSLSFVQRVRVYSCMPLCVCATTQSDTSEIYEHTSSVPRANRPASYGPIQFNFENKQPPTATLVNLFRNPASRSRYVALGNVVGQDLGPSFQGEIWSPSVLGFRDGT